MLEYPLVSLKRKPIWIQLVARNSVRENSIVVSPPRIGGIISAGWQSKRADKFRPARSKALIHLDSD